MHWDEEYRRADAEMMKLYQKLAGSDPTDKKKLRAAQKAWMAYRDAEAEAVCENWEGGSGQNAAVNSALAILTRERIRDLKEWF